MSAFIIDQSCIIRLIIIRLNATFIRVNLPEKISPFFKEFKKIYMKTNLTVVKVVELV